MFCLQLQANSNTETTSVFVVKLLSRVLSRKVSHKVHSRSIGHLSVLLYTSSFLLFTTMYTFLALTTGKPTGNFLLVHKILLNSYAYQLGSYSLPKVLTFFVFYSFSALLCSMQYQVTFWQETGFKQVRYFIKPLFFFELTIRWPNSVINWRKMKEKKKVGGGERKKTGGQGAIPHWLIFLIHETFSSVITSVYLHFSVIPCSEGKERRDRGREDSSKYSDFVYD